MQNVDIYQTAGLGILAQYSENLSVENTRIIPNAAKGRFFDSHDDGVHVSNCKGLVRVVDSVFDGLLDDPINVHGTTVKIIEKKASDTVLARFMHHQSMGLDFAWPGDRISFLDNTTMLSEGEGEVKAIKALSATDVEIVFKSPIPGNVRPDFALENLTWAPDVEIKRNFFGNGRARSVLVSTPGHVVIEDNRFESSGSAILIAGDANYWFESGAVRDVLIRNNEFADECLTNNFVAHNVEYRGMVDEPSFCAIVRAVTKDHPCSRVSWKAASTIMSLVKTVLCVMVSS